MNYCIAVLDIGKTNKKIALFDDKLNVVYTKSRPFPTVEQDGLEIEPVEEIESWFLDELSTVSGEFPITCITVATHGATFACIGEDGNPSVPVVSYTNEPGPEFHHDFYKLAGDKATLQRTTATLELSALVNPAQGVFFVKRRFPEKFAKTRHILFYPQYFGFRLTGNVGADLTYVGCHTYLYDFHKERWSDVAQELGVAELLPDKRRRPWEILGTITPEVARRTGLDGKTIVTLGIHDSNASLLPHLVQRTGDFILNSTGTWCVAMHPTDRVAFNEDEIGKSVFFNLGATGQPVKTTILMGGLEFEAYTTILKEIHGDRPFPEFSADVYRRVIADRRRFVIPGVVQGTGQFPTSTAAVVDGEETFPLADIQSRKRVPAFFEDFEEAYAVVNLSLAVQSKVALERVGIGPGMPVYTEGGFRKNRDYMTLLAGIFPESTQYVTNIEEATAFGAAIVGKLAVDGGELSDTRDLFSISDEPIEPASLGDILSYADALIAMT